MTNDRKQSGEAVGTEPLRAEPKNVGMIAHIDTGKTALAAAVTMAAHGHFDTKDRKTPERPDNADLIASLRDGVISTGGFEGDIELFDIDGAETLMAEAADALAAYLSRPEQPALAAVGEGAVAIERINHFLSDPADGFVNGISKRDLRQWRDALTAPPPSPDVAAWDARLTRYHQDIVRLQAENERLTRQMREALDEIRDMKPDLPSPGPYNRGWNDARFRVRATLSRLDTSKTEERS